MKKYLIILFVLIALVFPCLGFAADYYVKNGGNDADTGADDAHAWETIAKVNSYMGSLNSGDNVYFNKGDTWTNDSALTITASGSAGGGYITFGSYGTGDRPLFYWTTGSQYGVWAGDAGTAGPDYVKLSGLHIKGSYYEGISVYGTRMEHQFHAMSRLTISTLMIVI